MLERYWDVFILGQNTGGTRGTLFFTIALISWVTDCSRVPVVQICTLVVWFSSRVHIFVQRMRSRRLGPCTHDFWPLRNRIKISTTEIWKARLASLALTNLAKNSKMENFPNRRIHPELNCRGIGCIKKIDIYYSFFLFLECQDCRALYLCLFCDLIQ